MFYGWWIVIYCFIMAFYVAGAVFWGFTAFFEPLVAEFNWSYAQVSFATSLRGLEMGLLAPLVGWLADRYSLRWLLTAGLSCVGLGLIVLSQTTTLVTFYAAILLLAFGAGGCTTVVHMSLMANWFKRRIGLAMGITGSGFGTSGLAIPFIVDAVDTYGWRWTLIGLGLGAWLICVPLSLLIRDRPEDMGLLPDGAPPEPDSEPISEPQSQPDNKAEPPKIKPVGDSDYCFTDACFSRSFMALFAAESIRSLMISGVSLHIMPYLSTVGMSRSDAGLMAAGLPLLSVLGRFGLGYLGDKFDKRWMMIASLVMMSLGLLVYYPVKGLGLGVIFLLMFAPGMGGGMVLRASILSTCFQKAYFGRLVGLVMAAAAVGGIVGPLLTGWYYDTYGDYRPLWLMFSGLTLLSAGLIRFIKPIGGQAR